MNNFLEKQTIIFINELKLKGSDPRIYPFPMGSEHVYDNIHFPIFYLNLNRYILLYPVKRGERHTIVANISIFENKECAVWFIDGKQVDYIKTKKRSLYGEYNKYPPIKEMYTNIVTMKGIFRPLFKNWPDYFIGFNVSDYESNVYVRP